MMIPQPSDLGFPEKFRSWRPQQVRAIEDGMGSSKRFVGQMALPGTGKSLIYMAQAILMKSRTMILTSTKGLQDQLADPILGDFSSMGLVMIKGKSNYSCNDLVGHTCEEGDVGKCIYRGTKSCTWSEARDIAFNSRLVTTNYSCWLATNRFGRGFGDFDLLVMDEAHNSAAELAKSLEIRLHEHEILDLKARWPVHRKEMEDWKGWAMDTKKLADDKVQALKLKIEHAAHPSLSHIRDFKHYKNLSRHLAELSICNPDKWVVEKGEWNGYKFDPIDPAEYAERAMFRGIPKVLLTSGTIGPRTLQTLGIREDDFDFFEYQTKIKPGKSPLIFVPTAFVSRNSSTEDLKTIVERCDEIIEMRADRRGIIHTSNFKIRDFIKAHSQYSKYMVSNYASNGDVTSAVVRQFKQADPPVVLVTPSVSTGYDFAYNNCRYQIIAKLPYPDYHSNKVDREREKLDPNRGIHHMWMTLAQQYGRGDRAEDDWAETFILDNNIERAVALHGNLAPWWLLAVYRKLPELPLPPDIS